MPRAIWSGAISFGLVNIPVKLYNAVSRKSVHFNQIDSRTRFPHPLQEGVGERRDRGPERGDREGLRAGRRPVRARRRRRARALDPEAARTIDIEEFVDLSEIDPVFYDSAYYCAPDKGAAKSYTLLAQAMEESGKVAIARFVMRSKQYLSAVRPKDGTLVLSTMVYADEVNAAEGASELGALEAVERDRPRAGDGPPAGRVAVGRLRAREVPRHLPRAGARRSSSARRRASSRWSRCPRRRRPRRWSTSWPPSRPAWRRPSKRGKRHPTARDAAGEDGEAGAEAGGDGPRPRRKRRRAKRRRQAKSA